MDVNMAHSWQRPVLSTVAQNGVLKADAKPPVPGKKMMYELRKPGMKINGAKMEYVAPVELIDKNIQFRVWVEENDSTRYEASLIIRSSLASAKQVSFAKAPSEHYPGKGGFTLVDGIVAVLPRINSEWLGWSGDDMIATIDLGSIQPVTKAEIGVLHDPSNWIYRPAKIQLESSTDGTNWNTILSTLVVPFSPNPRKELLDFGPVNARYFRISAKNPGLIPEGNPGAGKSSWIFFDEIILE
jgi:hexosaminidase